jgi:hypothetical protein
VLTTLFFMWGFLTCLNDILVPHFKAIFDLSYARVMLIQFAFFSAYFLFSVPWSKLVNTVGYQRTMVIGLFTMAFGSFLFLPAASAASYPLFLTALLILAAGMYVQGLEERVAVDGSKNTVPEVHSDDSCRRILQLDHVPHHLQLGSPRTRDVARATLECIALCSP